MSTLAGPGDSRRCRKYEGSGAARCRNPAGDSGYCSLHNPGRRDRCQMGCLNFPRRGGRYCGVHERWLLGWIAACFRDPGSESVSAAIGGTLREMTPAERARLAVVLRREVAS